MTLSRLVDQSRLCSRSVLTVAGPSLAIWGYCQPGHFSAGRSVVPDALMHLGFFAILASWVLPTLGRNRTTAALLVAMAVYFEWLQRWRGGYIEVEYGDVAWNITGVMLGWCLYFVMKEWFTETNTRSSNSELS